VGASHRSIATDPCVHLFCHLNLFLHYFEVPQRSSAWNYGKADPISVGNVKNGRGHLCTAFGRKKDEQLPRNSGFSQLLFKNQRCAGLRFRRKGNVT
jgi:hypothetical protein